ncbi:hypothetical protein GH714_042751 [Hevea brasiliensis]|uniref:NADH-ubiquinone oxidoreductase chain 5 n=4 Tax=Eukaryota TaxID=2759 RepID=A0A6A6JZT6_HEVBR|nr:hypothetical protein GH714_042751 [Hevea brasiliensis]
MFSVEFLCVTLPLIGAIIGQAMGRSRLLSAGIISSCVFCSAVLSWYLFLTLQQRYSVGVMPWFQIGDMAIAWSICIDKLSAIMLVVVTTVSLMVHLYSIGYMSGDSGGIRFLAYLSVFTFFMMVLVTSGNFVQLFFGWEGVGLCSYLLIGFWFKKDAANRSAMKAFVVNRVGDLFFLCGMLAIFYVFRSLSFDEIFEQISNGEGFGTVSVLGYQTQIVSIACILLFLGCMGKSAQLGLHTWLPDAMEGPTPASALIHAATMVTAGVFLIARCSPIFELSQAALDVVLVIGLATCLVAALVAIVQEDIKKIIAYSTCSQLGYMFVACGTANYHLAIFHLATHALFKSLLFLAAGNVIHSNAGEQRITHMSKNCWRDIPLTYALMWIGSLSLMGVFPFAGLMLKVFHNPSTKRISSIHESSGIMLFPLLVLAVGAVVSGMLLKSFWGITGSEFWGGSLKVHAHEDIGLLLSLLPAILGVAGALLYLAYHNRLRVIAFPDKLARLVHTNSHDLSGRCRPKVIDYFLLGGITEAVSTCARYSVKVQSGRAFDYALVMLSGVATTLLVVYGFDTVILLMILIPALGSCLAAFSRGAMSRAVGPARGCHAGSVLSSLVPMFFMIGFWGHGDKVGAAFKFLIYTATASVGFLAAVACIDAVANATSSSFDDTAVGLATNVHFHWQVYFWILCFIVFAVKLPVVPCHTWLPSAHVQAPTAGSVLLAGLLIKLGGYGLLRFCIQMLPTASAHFAKFVICLSAVSLIYASLTAFAQRNMKMLVAYSSVAHMSFVAAGMFSLNEAGMLGRTGTMEMSECSGLASKMPRLSAMIVFFSMASAGIPGMVLSAAYMLRLCKEVVWGSAPAGSGKFDDINIGEFAILAALAILVLVLGVFPAPLLTMLKPAVEHLLVPLHKLQPSWG